MGGDRRCITSRSETAHVVQVENPTDRCRLCRHMARTVTSFYLAIVISTCLLCAPVQLICLGRVGVCWSAVVQVGSFYALRRFVSVCMGVGRQCGIGKHREQPTQCRILDK
jgi:hypothetical protein